MTTARALHRSRVIGGIDVAVTAHLARDTWGRDPSAIEWCDDLPRVQLRDVVAAVARTVGDIGFEGAAYEKPAGCSLA
jgi:hypothetical protein